MKSCGSSTGYGRGLSQPEWDYRMKIDTILRNLTFNVGRLVHGQTYSRGYLGNFGEDVFLLPSNCPAPRRGAFFYRHSRISTKWPAIAAAAAMAGETRWERPLKP